MDSWEKLSCEECGSKQHMELSTGDGDKSKSKVLCAYCSGKNKEYIIRRGYQIDYDMYFGPPECIQCGCNEIENLRNKPMSNNEIYCLSCIESLFFILFI